MKSLPLMNTCNIIKNNDNKIPVNYFTGAGSKLIVIN